MWSFKMVGIVMLLTVVNILCSGAVTRNNGPNTATVLGPGSIKVHDGQTGKTTILDGPNGSIKVLDGPKGKVRRETNTPAIQRLGSHAPERVRRGANTSVIEHLGPKISEREPHGLNRSEQVGHNASGKVRRETNSTVTLHRVILTKGRMRRGAKLLAEEPLGPNVSNQASTPLKPTDSAVNASTSVATTTPKGVGNMITVPDNCPEGKKFVNGECREIWEPSR